MRISGKRRMAGRDAIVMEGKGKMLPIGIEDFKKLREKDYYYVDKTGMIRELLSNQAEVTLFTRPRRFGKSLNMSMLFYFFSVDGEKGIFSGLEIEKETGLCEKYMGKYPVIFISLKEIEGEDFEDAFRAMVDLVIDVSSQYYFLLDSERLSRQEKARYERLLDNAMDKSTLSGSLKLLCELLEKHYGKKVVLLIDEYDVPLQKAFLNGYYDAMVALVRRFLGAALKTNASLEFAVLTGCLRVAKESIFTGLNNLAVFSITDDLFDDCFGFTKGEVKGLLANYGLGECYEDMRRWYDGYHFGGRDLYCPWDVLNHCRRLLHNPKTRPKDYWINTSGNDAVRRFVRMADEDARQDIEDLVAGEAIEKEVREDLTYAEMYDSIDNLWSLLFMTGYLTRVGEFDGRTMRLAIPNLEVRDVFVTQISDWFKERVRADADTLERFCGALKGGDAKAAEEIFNGYLGNSISVRDAMAREGQKENFYHGMLLGILAAKGDWGARSNQESGDGYADIIARPRDGNGRIGVVFELKYAADGDMEAACMDALDQIEKKGYEKTLRDDGIERILKYGFGCYKKRCMIRIAPADNA